MSQSFFNFLNRFVTFNSFRHAFGVPPPSKREALFFRECGLTPKGSLLEGAVSEAD